jgi:Arc/MetJ-type ribon-helix-helix transcriptional regulator
VPSKDPLIQLNIPQELIDRIDDFRFAHRFPSRAATIKWLVDKALDARLAPEQGRRKEQERQEE